MAKKKGGARWLAQVRRGMEKRGTVGAFTAQAERQGLGVQQYAARVLGAPARHTLRTVRRARFARTMGEIGARRTGRRLPPVLRVMAPPKVKVKAKRRRARRKKRAA